MPDQPSPQQHSPRLPNQRWQIAPAQATKAYRLSEVIGLSPILAQVLINRGIETTDQAEVYLNPESLILPSPLEEFADLGKSVELLEIAIASQQKIAICGDYDADGMTSTALLLRSLRWLGANVDYAIPSRMKDGYGINQRIVEEFYNEGVQLILTVDNGISAYHPIERARELGIKVIITDHHDLPEKLPPADAILNPKLIPESSPYRCLAGVGVAYILAVTLARQLDKIQGLVKPMLELFTLGTIADLAPLTGVNRRWLKRGLQQLPHSNLTGIQALIHISGIKQGTSNCEQINYPLLPSTHSYQVADKKEQNSQSMKPEDIGFRLGPRINAVGRIDDPQIIIDLLTTDDMGLALERAMQCEEINKRRQQLCEDIEKEAVAWCEEMQNNSDPSKRLDLQQQRVLVVVQPKWHHGVIGIVASRLVERYGVPVFIGTYEDDGHIRGSARGIPEFHIFEALEFCQDLLGKYGGHKAAGGFSFPAENLTAFQQRLSIFAHKCLEPKHLKPLLKIDGEVNFEQINLDLYQEINYLHPCGIENPDPIFWTPNVRVLDQKIVGKGHIKLTLLQDAPSLDNGNETGKPLISNQPARIKAIAWRSGDYFPLPPRVDIAYKLKENTWNGNTNIELELLGFRLPVTSSPVATCLKAEFYYSDRHYNCSLWESLKELRIKYPEGKVLAIQQGQKTGLLGTTREEAKVVDVTKPPYYYLIKAAVRALNLPPSDRS